MDEYNNVVIELEDGRRLNFEVLAIFEVNDNSYAALAPVNSDCDEIVFYGCEENGEEGELNLHYIEDEEELEIVCEAFTNLMEEMAKDIQEEEG